MNPVSTPSNATCPGGGLGGGGGGFPCFLFISFCSAFCSFEVAHSTARCFVSMKSSSSAAQTSASGRIAHGSGKGPPMTSKSAVNNPLLNVVCSASSLNSGAPSNGIPMARLWSTSDLMGKPAKW